MGYAPDCGEVRFIRSCTRTEIDALARKSPVPLVPAFVQGSRVTVEGYEGSTAIVTGVSKTGLWVSVNGSAPARVAPRKVRLMQDTDTASSSADENAPPQTSSRRELPESYLDCPVCLNTVSDPVGAACGHAYCRACFDQLVEHSKDKGCAQCPLCRNEVGKARPLPMLGSLAKQETLRSTSLQQDIREPFAASQPNTKPRAVTVS